MHLWSNGEKGTENVRKDLENELARTPKEVTLIIGGDFNSHVGRQSQRDGVFGKYGLSTRTGEAGSSLLDWCEENNLQHVNTFYRLVKKMMVMQDITLSDHKPVSITISRGKKEKRHRVERRPAPINWEKLKQTENPGMSAGRLGQHCPSIDASGEGSLWAPEKTSSQPVDDRSRRRTGRTPLLHFGPGATP